MELWSAAQQGWGHTNSRAAMVLVASLVLAGLIDLLFVRVLASLSRRTANRLDDALVLVLSRPLAVTVALGGAWYAASSLLPVDPLLSALRGMLASGAVFLWVRAGFLAVRALLAHWGTGHPGGTPVHPRTLPLLDVLGKTVLIAGGLYFLLLAWGIDVTAWLASAGMLSLAFGFAAKDSLANLFAGIFILADAPYKIGDMLYLDDGTRGKVTEVGLRSTRMITRDDIEINIPNSLMASARIVNESGGPLTRERVRCPVPVAYGCDVDHVRAALIDAARHVEGVVIDDPEVEPRMRFRAFGEAGFSLEVLVWIRDPADRGIMVDRLIVALYQRMQVEGIEVGVPVRLIRNLQGPGVDPPTRVTPVSPTLGPRPARAAGPSVGEGAPDDPERSVPEGDPVR